MIHGWHESSTYNILDETIKGLQWPPLSPYPFEFVSGCKYCGDYFIDKEVEAHEILYCEVKKLMDSIVSRRNTRPELYEKQDLDSTILSIETTMKEIKIRNNVINEAKRFQGPYWLKQENIKYEQQVKEKNVIREQKLAEKRECDYLKNPTWKNQLNKFPQFKQPQIDVLTKSIFPGINGLNNPFDKRHNFGKKLVNTPSIIGTDPGPTSIPFDKRHEIVSYSDTSSEIETDPGTVPFDKRHKIVSWVCTSNALPIMGETSFF